jgi:hypothetical protein
MFTGMPVLFPMAVIMAFELGIYGLTASLAVRKLHLPSLPALIMAMFSGRITAGISVALMVQLFGIKMDPVIYLKGAIITGMPGIVMQLLIIPTLVYAIRSLLKKSSVLV